ncbi:MAG: TonB-dependent receptor [Bacteroidia bacterium]|nr:TonB-dependent receptor [Bacteroidia bacterium]
MKNISAFLFLLLLASKGISQEIQVISANDSLRVPYASLLITSNLTNYCRIANESGLISIVNNFEDSVLYEVKVQCFGFEKFDAKYKGYQIRKLTKIVLLPSKLNLEEVVITAQYEPMQAEKSVQKIKVIDKEKIQQMGAVNLRDVLSNQLNVRLSQDNILGSSMNLQGISGQNVKILIDGVPMIGRLNGDIDLSQINMNNVERIELIEGPLSVQYGTNALAGTINIITKKKATKTISASITPYYESVGTYNLTGDVTLFKKGNTLQLNGGRNYFDGWNNEAPFYFPKPSLADSTRYKQWKPKEQYFGGVSYSHSFRKGDFGFASNFFDELIINRGLPRAPYGETAFDDTYHTRRIDNNLSLKLRLRKHWSVNGLVAYNYYNRVKRTVFKDLTTLEDTITGPSDQDTSTFTLLMSRASFIRSSSNSKLSYELGYDISYESALGKRIDKRIQYMGDYALFATAEYRPLNTLVIKPGIRYAYNTSYKTPLVPSLNVKWNLSERHTLRASYARGFRSPTLKELYFNFVDINHNILGNSDLRSEKSDNYSFAYNYNRDIRRCRVKFDLTVFYNTIFNLIDLAIMDTASGKYANVNIGRYKTQGIQLGNSLNFKKVTIQTGFNYTGRYNKFSEDYPASEFTYSPEVLANISYLIIAKHKTTVSLFYKYTGVVPGYALVETKLIQTSVSDFHTMDITTSSFFWKNHLGLTLGCKNIFNVKNILSTQAGGGAHSSSSSSIPLSTGRNYFIKLTLNI